MNATVTPDNASTTLLGWRRTLAGALERKSGIDDSPRSATSADAVDKEHSGKSTADGEERRERSEIAFGRS